MLTFPKNKVAVTPIFDPDTSPSGRIIIPDIAKERCDQGIVKYVGPDVEWVKIGMYVLFSGYTGTLIKLEGEGNLIVMPEDFIIAEIGDVDNIHVPGLFYKSRINMAQQIQELKEAIEVAFINALIGPDKNDVDFQTMARELSNGGFYGPLSSPYYQADYENIFNFISQAFQESEWFRKIKVTNTKPTLDEYDKLGGKA